MTKIAILGWGSLLWEQAHADFDKWREDWKLDGPVLQLEFSRKSASRFNALTLVIDPIHGQECRVAFALSKRKNVEDAKADLRAREGTNTKNIGYVFADGSRLQGRDANSVNTILQWAKQVKIDVVIWTDLPCSFEDLPAEEFVAAAVRHVQELLPEGKVKAAEYVWRAPDFVNTPLRAALQAEPWFKKL